MQALAICGSPRPNGNTEQLLTRCLAKLQSAGVDGEQVRLAGKNIRGCSACGSCRQRQDRKCDDEVLQTIDRFAENLAWLAAKLEAPAETKIYEQSRE